MPSKLRTACLLLFTGLAPAAWADCPPAGWDTGRLAGLKAAGFVVADAGERQALALEMVDCLASPDPALRDGLAYEAFATWLRADALEAGTREALLAALVPQIAAGAADPDGFRAPFAALVLSEVARTDRVAAWMTPGQRDALVEAAAAYLESVRDYRGFDAREGWRHGVAHGADLLMQLALNPALEKPALDRILSAVARQVAPPGEHAYVHGEAERLVRPVLFVLQRNLHDEAAFSAWLQGVVAPAPLATWGEAFGSAEGLAKRHNTRGFLLALYVALRESTDPALQARTPAVVAALRAMQ